MSIWNKILIGLIFVTAVAFFYMGARTLKTHQYWRDLARDLNEQIRELEEENDQLVNANPEEGEEDENGELIEMGIKRLRLELHKLLLDRGRVWYNCTRERIGEDGKVAVKTDLPNPNLIKPKTTLFLFEEKDIKDKDAPDKGQYLGEFIVTGVADRVVDMRPVKKMSKEEEAGLSKNPPGTWCMYDIMPIDVRSVFSKLSDDEKKAILPSNTVTEYLKDGKPAEPDDPEHRVLDGKYVRLLRDYKILFESYHRRTVILADKKAENEQDWQYVKNTYEDAIRQRTFRQAEVAQRKQNLARVKREDGAIIQLGRSLQTRVRQMQVAIADLAKRNRIAAARIAKIQHEIAQRINARTRTMAQSTGGS